MGTFEIATSSKAVVYSVGSAFSGNYPELPISITRVTTNSVVDLQFNILDELRRAVTLSGGDSIRPPQAVLGGRK